MKAQPIRIYVGLEPFQSHFRRIACGIATYAHHRHLPWLLMDSWTRIDVSNMKHPVDAAVLQNQDDLAAECARLGIPWIQVSATRSPQPGEGAVLPDNYAIGQVAGEYFLARGFRNFAFLGGPDHYYVHRRRAGFEAAIAGHSYSRSEADVLQESWVNSLPTGTALFCCNDIRARTAIRVLREFDRSVPEDVAVLGVDDDDIMNAFAEIPISSVDPRSDVVGQTAGEELARLLANKQAKRRVVLVPPGGVIVRQSSDIIALTDPVLALAVATIREQAVKGLTVGDVIKKAAVSRRTLERKFESTLGRGIEAEIRRVRIERAKDLLNASDLRIGEVATSCGFTDIFHFSAAFKKSTGFSPGTWRRRVEIVG